MLLHSWCPSWDAPITLVCLMVIKIQLWYNLLSDTIPSLNLPGRTDHAFTVCPTLPLPQIHTHCILSIHLIIPIIYLSIGPFPLLSYELVEGKDPHSSLYYLEHNAGYRVCGQTDGWMDQHKKRVSYNERECPISARKVSAGMTSHGLVKEFGSTNICVLILKSLVT